MNDSLSKVIRQIEDALGPVAADLELTINIEEDLVDGKVTIRFLGGKDVFSPMVIRFYRNETGEYALGDARIVVECFDLIEFGDTEWIHWLYLGTQNHRLSGSDDEMLTLLRKGLEDYVVIDLDASKHGIIRSSEFAHAFEGIESAARVNDAGDISVERDLEKKTESAIFEDVLGRQVTVSYPFDVRLPAVITVDGRKVSELPQDEATEMEKVLDELIDPENVRTRRR